MTSRTKILQGRLLASTIFASAALIASPAYAQDDPPAQTAEESSSDSTIVVTGTLVRNPNLVSSSPVNVTDENEIELQQANVAEELLRELPGAVPSIGSAVNNGNGGNSFVNLRGLGANRNVVLLDGVRVVPSTLGGLFDLNNIPLALIQRVDVLTGGASTTYGADAVSGVVNFITRQDFAGIDINLSEQITERGDGNVFRADVTIGANFTTAAATRPSRSAIRRPIPSIRARATSRCSLSGRLAAIPPAPASPRRPRALLTSIEPAPTTATAFRR
ncbi:MAG: TonB-dependent receptor plug domain-containing protein [Sphingosinicella sp.]|uniref:TonB-dependent receptor plug domain-containing protein n=1 Tax=Sphingosinicella sp. TaxID=1917971 RepID=UPI00403809B5